MACVKLKNINKIYPNGNQAVYDFNLDIEDKEFIVFVGPSGCGKTTTLRMIAGLEEISSGQLYIDDKFSNYELPKNRDIAMVFQDYALYPHLNVYDNMAYGLKIKKIDKKEIDKRVRETAKLLGMEEYLTRKPKELSGGQRQRVALGRAIVKNAKVFLMDEPLSNLDAKLRVLMRAELISLYEKLQATVIYVTHDQTEAMTMATRIVVMKDGYIQQIGTPKEIYLNPANKFVAGFMGAPAMNFINSKYSKGFLIINDKVSVEVTSEQKNALKDYEGKEVIFGVRPEDIELNDEGIEVETTFVELLGSDIIVYIKLGDIKLQGKYPAKEGILSHSNIRVKFNMNVAHIFDKDTEMTII